MQNWRIKDIKAREVLNNKGCPVLEVDVISEDGRVGRASASFGVSAGIHEVVIVRDGGKRYGGMGVLCAIKSVIEQILPALKGMDCREQRLIDETLIALDGTADKSKLGGNTICSVSLAVAKLGAQHNNMPIYQHLGGTLCNTLPMPLLNLINGGPYSAGPADFQEFHVVPAKAENFAEAMRIGVEVLMQLPEVIKKRFGKSAYQPGHLGGIAAPTSDPKEILDTLLAGIDAAGYTGECLLSLDCATSHLYDHDNDTYNMSFGKLRTSEMVDYFEQLVKDYPIFMLEDPLHEDDFSGFANLNKKIDTLICGDDLLVTNTKRLQIGVEAGSAGAMIFKPNMVGSVTEALDAARFATANGMEVIPSLRAATSPGDPTAELGVAVGARLMKVGAPQTGERTRQQNNLIRIAENFGKTANMITEQEIRKWVICNK